MSKKYWNVIGMMSGTSLDGVDIIYTRISKNNEKYNFKILHAVTIPYSKEWEQKLINAFTSSAKDIADLNVNYAIYLSGLINEFIRINKISKMWASSPRCWVQPHPKRLVTIYSSGLSNYQPLP